MRRPRDAHVPDVVGEAAAEPGDRRETPGAAAPELVGLHGDVDTARATL